MKTLNTLKLIRIFKANNSIFWDFFKENLDLNNKNKKMFTVLIYKVN